MNTTIKPGDPVAFTSHHNVTYFGNAASGALNDGRWPEIAVDFDHEDHPPRRVPLRDVAPMPLVTHMRHNWNGHRHGPHRRKGGRT